MNILTQLPFGRIAGPPRKAEGQRFLLHAVGWETYVAIRHALADQMVRVTFDQGNLELMTLSPEHERYKYLFGRLIDTLAEELNLKIGGFGSATQQRQDLEKGLEPDQCYYLGNLTKVRGKKPIDLTRDPPPDLAIEIDITQSSLNRMGIYADLGVPEVWRFDGTTLQVLCLGTGGEYKEAEVSSVFPAIPWGEFPRFIELGQKEDDVTMVRAFRPWIHKQLVQQSPQNP